MLRNREKNEMKNERDRVVNMNILDQYSVEIWGMKKAAREKYVRRKGKQTGI